MASISQSATPDTSEQDTVVALRRRIGVRAAAAAIGLYLLGALYLLAHVLPSFDDAIPGWGVAGLDGWQNAWNIWWTRLALSRGQNPYFTDMLFYPDGQSLYLHTLNITNGLLTMPVQLIAGPIAAYNTALILGFVLTGFAAYLLAHYLIGHRGIAIAVGALWTFSPFHVVKLADGHLSWVTVFWVGFYLLCLVRALDSGQRRWGLLAGLFLAGATLTSYYYAIFSFIFTGLLIVVRLPTAIRRRRWRSELVSVLLIGGVAGALVSPVLIPALRDYQAQAQAEAAKDDEQEADPVWDRETETYSADLVDILFPSPLHPWWGVWATEQHSAMRYGWFWSFAPGYAVLALAIVGGIAAGRHARPWLVLVVTLWVLMLGPRLRIMGVQTSIPLPFDLLQFIPGMTLGHRPNHLAIFMLPLLMILAGFGMQALLRRGRFARGLLALLGVVLVIETMVLPMPALPFDVDPAIYQLRGQPGAVMDLPNLQRNMPAMIHQMAHGRPIVGGYLARNPDSSPFVTINPWIRQLWRLTAEPERDITVQHPDDGWQALSFYGLRTVIVRNQDVKPEDAGRPRQVLEHVLPGIKPFYQGPTVDVYAVDPVTSPRPFLFLGEGWHDREHKDEHLWRWMSAEATLQLVNPDSVIRPVTLELSVHSYQRTRPLDVSVDALLATSYQAPPDGGTFRLHLVLPPGEHTIRFKSSTDPEPSSPNRDLSLWFTRIALVTE